MDFNRQNPWTEDEIRHRILELQRQIEKCSKQLDVAQSEVALLTDQLRAGPVVDTDKPTILAGRLAGI